MRQVSSAAYAVASLFAIAVATGASAQTTTTPAPAASEGYDEIVVTAQRRSERLVDVPASVTAISGAAIAESGVTSIEDLTRQSSGVNISRTGAYLQPTIRGVGTNVTGPGADPNVALYVDGFYMPSQTGNFFDLPNVERVEILKGPQGTLFGRNATGGAILITTKEPSFDTTAQLRLGYGRFNEVRASAYVSTGLSETVAADIAGSVRRSDGWLRDLRTGDERNEQESIDVRGKLLFKPSDAVKITLNAAYNDTSDPTGLAQSTLNRNTAGRDRGQTSADIATNRRDVSQELKTIINAESHQIGLKGEFDLGFATLSTITGYRKEIDLIQSDLDSSYAPVQFARYDQYFKTKSQEVNLTSNGDGAFNWVIGAFYYHDKAGFKQFLFNNAPFAKSRIVTEAIAGYVDASYTLGNFVLLGGLRYSTEKRQFFRTTPGQPFTTSAEKTFKDLTPRVGFRYELAPSSNIYGTYTEGFKSGTFNASGAQTTPFVRPEKIKAFEVGYKTASARSTFSVASYYYKYSDIQVTAFNFNVGISQLVNAAKAEIYGVDIDGSFDLTDNLTVSAAASWTHARYQDFPGAPVFTPQADLSGNDQTFINAKGVRMLRAPDFTVGGTIDYRVPLGDQQLRFALRPYWTSKINFTFNERHVQPSYFTVDGNISYKVDENFEVSVYGKNLTDKTYATFRGATTLRDGIVYAQPITYGVALSYNY